MWYLRNDTLWIPVRESMQTIQTRVGDRLHGPDGPRGEVLWQPEIEYEPATFEIEGYDTEYMAPFTPRLLWELTADGGIVAGASDTYRFEIHRPGRPTLVVERYWEPVPVPPGHRDWERRDTVSFRRRYGATGWNWDGAEIPTHKPAFRGLFPTRSGATWVLRAGPSEQLTDCVEDPIEAGYAAARANPCWRHLYILDAFAADGRYLGRVETPPNLWPTASPFVDGDLVVAVTQDESGVFRVKRYRLVPPEED